MIIAMNKEFFPVYLKALNFVKLINMDMEKFITKKTHLFLFLMNGHAEQMGIKKRFHLRACTKRTLTDKNKNLVTVYKKHA